jgi:regulator of replication initiation timing
MPQPQSWHDQQKTGRSAELPAVFADETAVTAFEAAARQRKAFDELMTLVGQLTAQNTVLRQENEALTARLAHVARPPTAQAEPEDLFRGQV